LVLAYLSSHISAKRLAEAEEPPWDFPVVAYSMHGSNSEQGRYLYLDWEQLASEEGVRFRLPEPTGKVDKTGSKHGRRTEVTFRVLDESPRGQLVEVVDKDSDYNTIGRYLVVDESPRPLYYRSWGASTLVLGLLPGLIAGFEAGRFVYRRLNSGVR
jgi:hypothetical protein